jgi:hypothetical protein
MILFDPFENLVSSYNELWPHSDVKVQFNPPTKEVFSPTIVKQNPAEPDKWEHKYTIILNPKYTIEQSCGDLLGMLAFVSVDCDPEKKVENEANSKLLSDKYTENAKVGMTFA